MDSTETALIAVYVLVILVAIILKGIIWKYLNKKPLGMQTLIDPMIKDLIVLGIGAVITSTEPIFGFGLPLNNSVAFVTISTQLFVCNAWFIQNIALIATRYLSIFQPGLMSSFRISDAMFVKNIRIGNFLLSLTFLMFEIFTNDFKEGAAFKFLVGAPDPNANMLPLPTVKFLLFTNVLAMGFARFKIANYKNQDQCIHDQAYSTKTLKAVTYVAVIVAVVSLVRITGFVLDDFTKVTRQQVYSITATFALFNVIPAVFILKNKNMKKFAKKVLYLNSEN